MNTRKFIRNFENSLSIEMGNGNKTFWNDRLIVGGEPGTRVKAPRFLNIAVEK